MEMELPEAEEAQWGVPEQYMLAIALLPSAREVLTAWSFAVDYNNHFKDELIKQFADFASACKAVVESAPLKALLQVLLAVGTRMNVERREFLFLLTK